MSSLVKFSMSIGVQIEMSDVILIYSIIIYTITSIDTSILIVEIAVRMIITKLRIKRSCWKYLFYRYNGMVSSFY